MVFPFETSHSPGSQPFLLGIWCWSQSWEMALWMICGLLGLLPWDCFAIQKRPLWSKQTSKSSYILSIYTMPSLKTSKGSLQIKLSIKLNKNQWRANKRKTGSNHEDITAANKPTQLSSQLKSNSNKTRVYWLRSGRQTSGAGNTSESLLEERTWVRTLHRWGITRDEVPLSLLVQPQLNGEPDEGLTKDNMGNVFLQ